jgi:hypothetical protein
VRKSGNLAKRRRRRHEQTGGGAAISWPAIGSSTFPTMSGHNPTLTIQALAYMSADAIVNRYRKSPGPLL